MRATGPGSSCARRQGPQAWRFVRRAGAIFAAGALLLGCTAEQLTRAPGPPAPREPQAPIPLTSEVQGLSPADTGVTVIEPPPPERANPILRRGSGSFVQPPSRAEIEQNGPGEITLSFVDADIRDVARAILQDALGENYAIDPSVAGSVTLQSSEPLPLASLPELLDSVLRMNGATLIRNPQLNRIVPLDAAALRGASPTLRRIGVMAGSGAGLVVVPMNFMPAEEMAGLLEPFVPETGVLQAAVGPNALIMAGSPSEVDAMVELAQMFDTDSMAGLSYALEPLRSSNPEDIAFELSLIFEAGEDADPTSPRFIPIARLNSVLIIAPQPRKLEEARRWLRDLDQGGEEDEERIYIYRVQHATATDLAGVLAAVFGGGVEQTGQAASLAPGRTGELGTTGGFGTTRGGGSGGGGFQLGGRSSDRDTGGTGGARNQAAGTGGLGADDDDAEGERTSLASPLGEPRTGGTATRTSAFGQGPFSSEDRSDEIEPGRPSFTPDVTTNTLVIRAFPKDFRQIEQALEKLDILPSQVLIEATIAEVQLNDQLEYGIEWFFQFGNLETALGNTLAPITAIPASVAGFSAIFDSSDVRAIITALEAVTDVNIVSSPQLVVLDNQIARLQVGDEVPILTQEQQSIDASDDRFINSIEYRDTGVLLDVRPRISSNGSTVLEISQELSRVSENTTSGIDSPTINQRRVLTTVAIDSGETLALGGLIQEQRGSTETGVPGLRRIPILGNLFSTTQESIDRTELLVLLSPRVIRNREDIRIVTEDLRGRLSDAVRSMDPRDSSIELPSKRRRSGW